MPNDNFDKEKDALQYTVGSYNVFKRAIFTAPAIRLISNYTET